MENQLFIYQEDWRQLMRVRGIEDPFASDASERDSVWQASQFVARTCLRDPELLISLATTGLLHRAYRTDEMSEGLRAHLSEVASESDLEAGLRQFRNQQMVRIIWRDISRQAPLNETLEDLSELADICIRGALDQLTQWAIEKDGVPRDREGAAQGLMVLGMGKLGARELNLSSDIDLIFIFPSQGETDGRRWVSNEQFFTRLARRLINSLSKVTADGFVFRVDMRLRPFGDAGPLVLTLNAMDIYYQSQAREWERYAMVKARAITGSDDARTALMEILQPFVYRRYIDFGAIDSIRKLKRMIEAELHDKGMEANVKLGAGGIREIEFIGQAFQLIRGGRDTGLRVLGIQTVLAYLGQQGLLPETAVAELLEAYEFLRLVENRLQAWNDEQTHLLPSDAERRQLLAGSMGYDDWEAFSRVLTRHRSLVHHHFQQLFTSDQEEAEVSPFQGVWEGIADHSALSRLGYSDPEEVSSRIQDFRESSTCRTLSKQGHERLDRLMPMLLEACLKTEAQTETLSRLLQLLGAIAKRTAYIDLLVENPLALSQLVRLASGSVRIVSQLTRQPVLLDELLDPGKLYSPLKKDDLVAELDALIDQVDADDLEQQMERLRQFAQGNILRVSAADIADVIPLRVVSDYLTDIAETVLDKAVQLSWDAMRSRYGRPSSANDGLGFAVIGYGKLGGIELGYESDLDLVFLHDGDSTSGAMAVTDGKKQISNDVFYARLGQRIIHLLTTRTPSGILYETDMRLRPNGKSGMLVSSLKAYEQYQLNDAWVWEHQALLRARAVAGDPAVMLRFDSIRRQVLTQGLDDASLRTEVIRMREKMRQALDKTRDGLFDLKQGPGGIVDIEFMVQYAVLRSADQYPDLLDATDNIRLLDGLSRHQLLEGHDADLLSNAYQVFRAVSHRKVLQEQPRLIHANELVEERAMVRDIWNALLRAEETNK